MHPELLQNLRGQKVLIIGPASSISVKRVLKEFEMTQGMKKEKQRQYRKNFVKNTQNTWRTIKKHIKMVIKMN